MTRALSPSQWAPYLFPSDTSPEVTLTRSTAKRKAKPASRRPPATPPAADLVGVAIAADRGDEITSLLDARGQLPQDLTIEWPSITWLRAYPNNPRIHNKAIAVVRDSLLAFGWQQPIVVDADGVIIVGHTRYYAALDLQQHQVPVYIARRLTPDQAAAYRLMDNKSAEAAEWDKPKLVVELQRLASAKFDLQLTGFRQPEVTRLGVFEPGDLQPDQNLDDDVPPLPKKARTKPGDIYQLGIHRLMCGDCREKDDMDRLLDGATPELLWTDPPYFVEYVGKTPEKLTLGGDERDGSALLEAAFTTIDRYLVPGARFYICAPAGPNGLAFRLALRSVGWRFHQALVWVKNSIVLGHSDHHYRHEDLLWGWKPDQEDILYGWKQGAGRVGRGGHHGSKWFGDNAQSTVFEIARPSRSEEHPTMKPVELVVRGLLNSTPHGAKVLDPFCGAGATLLACAQTGRQAYLMDNDPRYCDVTVDRWEKATGQQARRTAA